MLNLHHGPHPRHSITEVYVTQILYSVGIALIGIFIPIYLLELGYTLAQAFTFLIVSTTITLAASPIAADLNYRIGFHKTSLVRIPFYIGGYLTLLALSYMQGHFLVPAVLLGASQALYFIPLLTLMAHRSQRAHRGSQVAKLNAAEKVATALAPAAGGLIALYLGFPTLILLALALVTISTVPLFLWREEKAKSPFRVKDMLQMRHHSFVAAIIGDGFMYIAVTVLFPILIYKELGGLSSVGFIETAGAIAFAITALIIGSQLDKHNRYHWLRIGAVLLGITLLLRPHLTTWEGLAGIAVIGGIVAALYHTSHLAAFYDAAEDWGDLADEFVVAREVFISLGKITLLGLVIMLPWTWGFYIAGAVLIGTALVNDRPQLS